MSDLLEWLRFGFDVFKFVVGIGLSIFQLLFILMMVRLTWSFWTEGKGGGMPSLRILFRRIYCRHRKLGRVRTRYGFHQTRCAMCGVDVNKGRTQEMRR